MTRFLTKISLFFFLCFLLPELFLRCIVPKISHHKRIEKAVELLPLIDENTILFLGDSRIEWGVKPLEIEGKTGLKTINLAMPGSNGLDILTYLENREIYPHKIFIGLNHYSPTWPNIKNIDNVNVSNRNRIWLALKYQLNKYSYLYEKRSIQNYLRNDPFLVTGHKYDNRGGVTVTERGEYEERKSTKEQYYRRRTEVKNLDSMAIVYNQKLSKKVNTFQKNKAQVFGLTMPICNSLRVMESSEKIDSLFLAIPFDEVLDYTKHFDQQPEEEVYMDCSHITPQIAHEFSQMLSKYIQQK